MTDRFVFVISPYVTGAAAVPACLVRYALLARRGSSPVANPASEGRGAVRSIWRWAIGIVALGHLAALGFPEQVLRWNTQPIRLLLLEGAGLTAGTAALVALIAMSVRRARSSAAIRSPWGVMAWTLLVIELASGIAVAVAFRWASSWSAVTVAPYVHSLLRFEPATMLVGRLPLLVKVHIFCAFAAAAVAPFTASAAVIVRPIDLLIRWTRSRLGRTLAASRQLVDAAALRLQPLSARMTRSDGEEN
jgi:nitrate reductase gamma subunit